MATDISFKFFEAYPQVDSVLATLKNTHQPYAVLDILIVGGLFYFFYLFLRQTRALRILYGIVILACVWALGQALQLNLLNTLLRWTFTSILVAVPVVFQPELRSALEKLGRTTNIVTEFNRLTKNEIEDIVDEILKAITILSKNKYGALIILSRSSQLREYAENGQIIDATLNQKFAS